MSDYYIGEIRSFGFNWPPKDWALCDGSVLTITQNQALFSLLGNRFGGDAINNFALPDLRGRAILGAGISLITQASTKLATVAGTETVTLTTPDQVPAHTHTLQACSAAGNATSTTGNILAQATPKTSGFPITPYAASANLTAMSPASIVANGASAPHDNIQPFTVVNFCIATAGLYPNRP